MNENTYIYVNYSTYFSNYFLNLIKVNKDKAQYFNQEKHNNLQSFETNVFNNESNN